MVLFPHAFPNNAIPFQFQEVAKRFCFRFLWVSNGIVLDHANTTPKRGFGGEVHVNTLVLPSPKLISQLSIFSLDQWSYLLCNATNSFSSSVDSHNSSCHLYGVADTLHMFDNVICLPLMSSSCGYFHVSSRSSTMLDSTRCPFS